MVKVLTFDNIQLLYSSLGTAMYLLLTEMICMTLQRITTTCWRNRVNSYRKLNSDQIIAVLNVLYFCISKRVLIARSPNQKRLRHNIFSLHSDSILSRQIFIEKLNRAQDRTTSLKSQIGVKPLQRLRSVLESFER